MIIFFKDLAEFLKILSFILVKFVPLEKIHCGSDLFVQLATGYSTDSRKEALSNCLGMPSKAVLRRFPAVRVTLKDPSAVGIMLVL